MNVLWIDLGEVGAFSHLGNPQGMWQDHGLGLLRTILHRDGILTDITSLRSLSRWEELDGEVGGYDVLLMNVRSYNYPFAVEAARVFKQHNSRSVVIVGGMHPMVARDEMERVEYFDRICLGAGENVISGVVKNPSAYARVFDGKGVESLGDWPIIDRELWPNPLRRHFPWPLEPECGWGPPPVVTIITSRVCPWRCSFCNEASYIPNASRRPVDHVIDELNYLDQRYGPIGSVVIHDSMFFQQPSWLEEWLEKYPRRARKPWPYWAAGRADTVRRWPELFESLVRETNWSTISIGFESGSDRVLRILNKECTVEDNDFTIDLVNRIGDDLEREGKTPPVFWSNIIFGIPGETKEDAFDTVRMMYRMRRVQPSVAYFAPYPGSALGYQLIAEGKSLLGKDKYHRNAAHNKVKGVDYEFYNRLLRGEFHDEIVKGIRPRQTPKRVITVQRAKV